MMRPALIVLFGSIALPLLILASCGLLNGAAAAGGVPAAKTSQAQRAAEEADAAVWKWIGTALFGGAVGVGAENKRQKRKRKQAVTVATERGCS